MNGTNLFKIALRAVHQLGRLNSVNPPFRICSRLTNLIINKLLQISDLF